MITHNTINDLLHCGSIRHTMVVLDVLLVLLSRDDPGSTKCFLASNTANKSCEIRPEAENIFAAVRYVFLQQRLGGN